MPCDSVGLITWLIAPGSSWTPDATGCAGTLIFGSGLGGSGASSLGGFAVGTVIFCLSGSSAFFGGSGVLLPPPPPPPPRTRLHRPDDVLERQRFLRGRQRHARQRQDEQHQKHQDDVRDQGDAERVPQACGAFRRRRECAGEQAGIRAVALIDLGH
jgi:hypothetical protein